MAIKPLPTQAALHSLLRYDPLTGELWWLPRGIEWFVTDKSWKIWNSKFANKAAFTAVNTRGYRTGKIQMIDYRACRIIWKHVHGVDPHHVDHIDGNTSNDRIANLRDVTHTENQKNRKRFANNTSGVTGVYWDTGVQRWVARVKHQGTDITLGRFKDINDAIAARKAAEIQYGFHPNHGR